MKLFEHFLYVKYNLQVHFFKNRIKVQKKRFWCIFRSLEY